MFISFFEEFPTSANLEKLRLINFPTKLYLASPSLKEFLNLKKKISRRYNQQNLIKEFIYWPVLTQTEGYWISPFSQRTALQRIFYELNKQKSKLPISVMLDLELPTTQNPILYFTQFFNFYQNRKMIKDFIQNNKGIIYLAEYYPEGRWKELILEVLGLHYSYPQAKIIKMIYHSLHHFSEDFIKTELKRGKKEFKNQFLIALGTIAQGIHSNEPILSPEQLNLDLQLAKGAGIKEVIIFRLGGLDKRILSILKKYT